MADNMNEQGEDENELKLFNTSKTRKKGNILDSDSESELEVLNNQKISSRMDDEDLQPGKTRKKGNILDSDSESEVEVLNNQLITSSTMDDEVPQLSNETITKKRLKRILESDTDPEEENVPDGTSENQPISSNFKDRKETDKNRSYTSDMEEVVEEEEVTPHNKSFPDEKRAIDAVVYTTSSKGELVPESTPLKKSLLALCDSESEEDTGKSEEILIPRVYKRLQKKKEDGPKKMSAQEAAKQRTEIHSESQRMLRESNVSLPYHKPKSYTIKEFLEKRSKLTSAVSSVSKAPPSVAIKMSKDQLKEVSEKLNERIKEVEEFYKSESEDEEEAEDDPSVDIRGWLNFLADTAVDMVESKIAENKEEASNQQANEEKDEEDPTQHESMEYEFDLDDVDENDTLRRPSILDLVKDKLNIRPKLSGTPNDIIDLEEGTTKLSGVTRLVEKFFRHTTKKVNPKNQVQLDLIEVCSGGEIVKETVSMNLDEEEPNLEETPGAKLQKLREDLQLQMAQKRLELWKQKQRQGDLLICEKKTENFTSQGEKDILDDEQEEEFEMTESETDDDEEEYEPEKPKAKSVFLDQEAEDDEEIDEDYNEQIEDDEKSKQGYEGDVDDVCDGFDSDEEETQPEEEEKPKKKVLKRIVKPFAEDSDEEEQEVLSRSYEADEETGSTNVLKYYTTDENDILPPNLPRVGKTPQLTQPTTEKKKSEFEFLTPVTYLTGLQNLNSDSKFSKESPLPNVSPEERDSQCPVQKKLFSKDSDISPTSQPSVEDLAHLCSGTFSETLNPANQDELSEEIPTTTQDLLNACSGDFLTLATNNENTMKDVEEVPAVSNTCASAENEIKNLDEEHDQIISQLLDEDEFERFKKKFESPVVRKNNVLENVKEVNATGLINSDDENEELEIKTKRRKMKLVFSDDEGEESDDDNLETEENIDLNNDDEEQQMENEIVAQESYNYKYSDFLDKEAELSESEWGSADEDEKGLDDLEFEQGDEETFNENKMRSEIERMHMRQLLDEDNREVKLLQELLLEDGELHGTGRKRQFRWKTPGIDSANNGEFKKGDDDDIYLDEEESEEQWRKMRHKREMFLKKKSDVEDDDSILGDSQILKLGQQILKNRANSQSNTPVNKAEDVEKQPFSLLSKRGSFLSRGDQVLQRLAEYNKVTTTAGANTARNSKCFVFQSVQAGAIVKDNNNKRKATEGTPNVVKRLRLDDISPAVKNQPGKSSRAKKLFGNW